MEFRLPPAGKEEETLPRIPIAPSAITSEDQTTNRLLSCGRNLWMIGKEKNLGFNPLERILKRSRLIFSKEKIKEKKIEGISWNLDRLLEQWWKLSTGMLENHRIHFPFSTRHVYTRTKFQTKREEGGEKEKSKRIRAKSSTISTLRSEQGEGGGEGPPSRK